MSSGKSRIAPAAGKRANGTVKIGGSTINGKTPAKKRHRRLPIFFWSVLIVAIGIFAFYKATVKPPVITPVPTPDTQTQPDDKSGQSDGQNDQGTELQQPVTPGMERKKDFYTFLIVGTDKAGANTDVMMVASFDTANHQANIINIPRDTLVNVKRKVKKINAAYSAGGMDNLKKEVSTLIGFEPDFYLMVDLKGFVALVDFIDGVNFDVPVDMNYDDPTQDLSIHFEKGMQHLDGQEALEVVRFRHNNDGTGYLRQDLDRIQTTQKLIKAVAKKMITPKTLFKLNDLVNIAGENVDSDLKFGEMLWIAQEALGVDSEEGIHFYTLSEKSSMYQGLSYVFVDENEALELINSTINPYTTDITDLDVIDPR